MNQEVAKPSYRGVSCLSCRQPIPLPGILLKMDSTVRAGGAIHEHPTRVFSLRCRACEKEKPYRATDIVDFEGAPRIRRSRARMLQPHPGRSRAANG